MHRINEAWHLQIVTLTEALQLAQYRPYANLDRTVAINRINTIWEGLVNLADFSSKKKDRLYFKTALSTKPVKQKKERIFKELYYELFADIITGEHGLKLKDEQGEYSALPDQIITVSELKKEKVLFPIGQFANIIFNATTGIVEINKRAFKIGTLIDKYVNSDIFTRLMKISVKSHFADYNLAKSNYSPSVVKDGYIVLTRHTYDIVGKSTGRPNWISCMSLPGTKGKTRGGEEYQYVKCDVQEGTFEAYFISPTDLNIKNPLGRLSIKPYIEPGSGRTEFFTEREVYGKISSELKLKVDDILKSVRGTSTGTFKLVPTLYADAVSIVHNGLELGPKTKVESVDLSGADLSGADFYGATFIDVDFSNSNLQHVNFTTSVLINSNFNNADIAKADFNKAVLDGADFTNVKNIDRALNLDKLKSSKDTLWPKGFYL